MLVLITYDVNVKSENGVKRLRYISKLCQKYGQRVQNSVFECSIDPSQLIILKNEMEKIIDLKKDNLRIYYLGSNWIRKVETIGQNKSYNPDTGFLMI